VTLHWSRWWPRIQAWRGGYFWVPCPGCGEPFGGQEVDDTHHFASIPGGEDDHRLICPSCTNSGVGCRAHAGTWIHDGGCDFVENVPLWAPQDGELPADEPPTETFEPVEPPHTPAHQQTSVYLDANHTALDAVRANQILNPQQPAPEENEDPVGRQAERLARMAEGLAAAQEHHNDLIAEIGGEDGRRFLDEHGPAPWDGDLVCLGCGPQSALDELEREPIVFYRPYPCPVTVLAEHLQRRDT
jgi:hypothetical protein